MSDPRKRRLVALLPMIVLLMVFVIVVSVPSLRRLFSREALLRLAELGGIWAPVAFGATMAVSIIVSPIPNVPISAVLGMIYGPWVGTLIAICGAIVGAAGAFWIARHFGRSAVRALSGKAVTFCEGCSQRTLSVLVFVARLIPVVSFDIVSYGAGLSTMGFWRFVAWSFIGMIPWTWFYTSFGSAVLLNPVLATVLGVVLAIAVLGLPFLVRRYNLFGLRRIMMEQARDAKRDDDEDRDGPRADDGDPGGMVRSVDSSPAGGPGSGIDPP